MATRRVFLGWDRPALSTAADELIQRFSHNMAGVTVVTATRRAGRHLEELLLERRPVLSRPTPATPGTLADALVEAAGQAAVGGAVAEELDAGLAWVSVLRSFEREALAALLPDPPAADDFGGWWTLARRVLSLREQLAAGRKTLADAGAAAGGSAARWAVLATLDQAYEATLAERGLVDGQTARERAISHARLTDPVVLVAVADLTPLHRAVINCCDDAAAFVFAEESGADDFDADGGLITDAWAARGLDVAEDALRVVEQRGDQPAAVAAAIMQTAAGRTEREVSVGLGEEALGPAVVRAVEQAGGAARTAVGRPLLEAAPCTLLAALARFVERRRFDALAELLRHPDVEAFLDREPTGDDGDDGPTTDEARRARRSWLSLLDRYLTETLEAEVTDQWLGDPKVAGPLRQVYQRIVGLIPDAATPRPLSAWSGAVRGVLEQVYGPRPFDEHDDGDAATVQAIRALARVLDEQGLLAASREDVPKLTATEAIRWTLARLASEMLADPPTRAGVEVMGLLDLALDDAPVAVVTSLNEGHVPGSIGQDAGGLLPGSLRSRLGLPDNRRRLARDTYLLRAVAASRELITFLAARHGDEGDPLKPSRLLLLGGDATHTARRLKWFYGRDDNADAAPALLRPGGTNRFVIPRPTDGEPVTSLSVTSFRDYLACPYRFYLKHVLELKTTDDSAVEMDALAFGNLVHKTLAAFALEDGAPRDATEPQAIADYLSASLERQATALYGKQRRAAVAVQLEFARERLDRYARLQADWTRDGWAIRYAELKLERTFDHAAGTVLVKGAVDRIDEHPELGLRIIDFKTGDAGDGPAKTHLAKRDGVETWIDLQLPLYRDLIDAAGLTRGGEVRAALGYFVLPRSLDAVKWCELVADDAMWREASAVRDAVIDGVLRRDFRPSEDTPRFDDGLARVCADAWPQRKADLAAGGFAGD